MHRSNLVIPEPCHADWSAMSGDERARFCSSCAKHVHDLSAMTPVEAVELLDQHAARPEGSLCVRYRHDTEGDVLFAARARVPTAPGTQSRGAWQLQAAALGLLLAACAPSGAAVAAPTEGTAALPSDESGRSVPAEAYAQAGHAPETEHEVPIMGDIPMEMGEAPWFEEPCDKEGDGDEDAGSADGEAPSPPPAVTGAPRMMGRIAPPASRPKTFDRLVLHRQEVKAAQHLAQWGLTLTDEEFAAPAKLD